MKRYTLKNEGPIEDSTGDWVRFEDVEVLLAELNLLRSQVANPRDAASGVKEQ